MQGDLPGLTLGWQVADWIETLLCHGPGDVEGEPIELDRDYLEATVRAYEVDRTGRRRIRRYILSRPKGRAKSEFAGMLSCAEALGPVRFDHWAVRGETSWWGYEYEQGEPVGKPVLRPFIRCLATEELQSGNTYDNVTYMLTSEKSPITAEMTVDAGLTRTYLPLGGEIRPSSASNAAKDGGKETFTVFDESHLYVLPELRAMAATVRRNCTKRNGWSLETTTMFELGANSTAEETFRAWDEGKLKRADVIFDHHEGPDPDTFDWDDDDQLLTALQDAYHPATWPDFQARISEIRDPTTTKADSVRFFLNRSHSSANDVTPLEVWDRLKVDAELKAGDIVTVGFDGSERRDSTAIVIVRGSDGLTVPGGLWERPEGAKDWEVPRSEVIARIDDLFYQYRIVRFYYDPRYWESDGDQWADKYGDKKVLEVPNSDARRAKASDRWEALIATSIQRLAAGDPPGSELSLCHDGNEDLRRHLGNATRLRLGGRTGLSKGWRPGKKAATRKIDLVDAALLAHEARGDAMAAGELASTDVSVMFV